jgi:hypothetical protein
MGFPQHEGEHFRTPNPNLETQSMYFDHLLFRFLFLTYLPHRAVSAKLLEVFEETAVERMAR